jgi:hypothetical protein
MSDFFVILLCCQPHFVAVVHESHMRIGKQWTKVRNSYIQRRLFPRSFVGHLSNANPTRYDTENQSATCQTLRHGPASFNYFVG